jgi:hypothetical protein
MHTWMLQNQENHETLIDVTRPEEHIYSFPWQFFYDIPLIEGMEHTFCQVIPKLDEVITNDPAIHKCPYQDEHEFGKTLCPFGFWGFRFKIQQHAGKGQGAYLKIVTPGNKEMLVTNTLDVRSKVDLANHIQSLNAILSSKNGKVTHETDKPMVMELMGNPELSLIYFYCHGYREKGYEATTYLSIGDGEQINIDDFSGYYYYSWCTKYGLEEYKKKTKPLVFINACHSIEINPDTLGSFLERFMSTQFASGIIGTEVSVDQTLAMDFANKFFSSFVQEGKSVGEAIHHTRLSYLAQHSLFGLVYTPYCFADLTLG